MIKGRLSFQFLFSTSFADHFFKGFPNSLLTIFLGYPIWWGDIPIIIKVFLQSYDFSGKTIIPFCTHGGSGLAGTDRTIGELCPDSIIGEGLAIRGSTAQNDRDSTKESVTEWLSDNGY